MTLSQAQTFFHNDSTGKAITLTALKQATAPPNRYSGICKGIEQSKEQPDVFSVYGSTLSGNTFNVYDDDCIKLR